MTAALTHKSPYDIIVTRYELIGKQSPEGLGVLLSNPILLFTLTDITDGKRNLIALSATIIVRGLSAAYNTPCYNVNIGNTCHYTGGDIHDNYGVHVPFNGPLETQLLKPLEIYPLDSITYQIGNLGVFSWDILVEASYTPSDEMKTVQKQLAKSQPVSRKS
jgi:hypothetical protein